MKFFVAAFLFFGASSAHAATYYVATNGSDSNAGTSGAPFASLSYACSKATNIGDIININAGNYTDNNRCNLAVGVVIQGAGVDVTTITSAYGGAYGTGYIYRINTANSSSPVTHGNNEISGFTLDGSGKTLSAGIWIDGSDNIAVHDMKFQHIKTTAIRFAGWDGWASYNDPATGSVYVPPSAYALNIFIYDVVIVMTAPRSLLSRMMID